jgi:hypothetical protein
VGGTAEESGKRGGGRREEEGGGRRRGEGGGLPQIQSGFSRNTTRRATSEKKFGRTSRCGRHPSCPATRCRLIVLGNSREKIFPENKTKKSRSAPDLKSAFKNNPKNYRTKKKNVRLFLISVSISEITAFLYFDS